ncbi:hypothetical protein M947_09000 [Sulfurimonas hongkongensis]|uniref:Uncharacterized protein n=1 Tax=Sulfurimonas hongkongensis TaxID=1172190 RepID=T0KF86_9BACT|nr:hypothetical protein [Sulfurimonas hongkongensis]EQB35409.1 hypothetical protein M947_09000 [Sulfurimonas hongkongensis]
MKKFILFLIITSSLLGDTFYTLDNIKNLRMYMTTSTNFLGKEKIADIEEIAKKRLLNAGFVFDGDDSATFMIKIEAVEIEDTQAIYVEIGIGEEVKTLREGDVYSFAFTYLANDLIESDDPYSDILESLDFLMSQFIEAYKIDNE